MGPPNRLFIACCALLVLATVTQSWRIDGNTWPKNFKKSSQNTVTMLGTGLDQNQLVFVECTNSVIRSCTVYTRGHDNCKFNLGDSKTAATTLTSVRQLANNRVIVVSSETDKLIDLIEHTLITFIDIERCRVTSNLRFNSGDLHHVEYENGIDVISDTNTTTRYNFDGSASLDRPKTFRLPTTTTNFRLYPVSLRWRSKGFFLRVINDTNDTVSLLQDDGVEFKRVLELPKASVQVEFASQQLYTVCWRDVVGDTHCAQFDEFGNEKTRNKLDNVRGETLFAVRNLRGGGYVRFSFDEDNSRQIRVTAIYLDREPEEATYEVSEATTTTKEMILADFYEKGGMFVVAYAQENGDTGFAMYKLPGKLAQQPTVQRM